MHASRSGAAAMSESSRTRVGSASAWNERARSSASAGSSAAPVSGAQQGPDVEAIGSSRTGAHHGTVSHTLTVVDASQQAVTHRPVSMGERMSEDVREQVRQRYAAAATAVTSGASAALTLLDGDSSAVCGEESCCTPGAEVGAGFGADLYAGEDRSGLPADALAASLGCGNPTAVAELREGETVLDLGSGGGIDVLLSARRVGPTGFAYGVDMTEEMLALAEANTAKAAATNVAFLKGTIEAVPLPDSSVDVVISNCVINLSTDKAAVLAEMFRLLRPGGRIGVSDVVAEDHLSPEDRAERGAWVGCIAGALSRGEYLDGLAAAGFVQSEVMFTHQAAEGIHSATIRAVKPVAAAAGR